MAQVFNLHKYLLNFVSFPKHRTHNSFYWPVRDECLGACYVRNNGCPPSMDKGTAHLLNQSYGILNLKKNHKQFCWLRCMCLYAQLFERLPSYRSLFQQSDWLKERISHLLGGIQVIHIERMGPALPLEEHYSTLNTFHKRLLPQRLSLHPRSMQGLTMTLEK